MTQDIDSTTAPGARVWITHGIFIVAVIGIGGLLGATFTPGEWYGALTQPSFTPPPWVFAPVWTTLYVLIGWVGARKFLWGGAMGLWGAQMVANFCWTPVFFGLHRPFAALIVIAVMWVLIAAFILREWRSDRLSAVLFLPYLVWVTIATAVNTGVVWLN